ncbi:uncharacterized protein N7483_010353 [Penicillium malachiteum]|uniref:uncharacterized protein n=1 Tax=Penicillium malachiteum TaxID=1324776 RepID=UPI002546EBD2|nr:uncharacterized protein N7483_010353 [Penicillium malachiteum]KAJ5713172.1 hypothetical protein N7483_010353 [Penicillium malachiteum]
MTSNIPEILLLCMDNEYISAFEKALRSQWPDHTPDKIKITTINERLNSIPPATTFDLIVSPANSYGRLDGAFDDAISRTFSPREDYHALTRATQLVLYEKWRGFAPPGSCTLVEFPVPLKENPRACEWIAICPTMREPEDVNWDREIVYECVWSLLNQVEAYNRDLWKGSASQKSGSARGKRINSMLLTPLAVGIGKVSKERWAAQMVLALKHFVDSIENAPVWSALEWDRIGRFGVELKKTWK